MADTTTVQTVDCQNVGEGLGLFANNTGGQNEVLSFKSLIGGPGIILNEDMTTITIEYVGMANGGAIPFSKIVGAPTAIAPMGLLFGTNDGRLDFVSAPTQSGSTLTFDGHAFAWSAIPPGTVTSIGLMPGPGIAILGDTITSAGSFAIGLQPTGIEAGSYSNATLGIDGFGRIISAVSTDAGDVTGALSVGSGAPLTVGKSQGNLLIRSIRGDGNVMVTASGDDLIVSSSAVTQVGIQSDGSISVEGGPITSSGTIKLGLSSTGVSAGHYTAPTLVIDATGRITAAMSNTPEVATGRSLGPGAAVFAAKADREFQFRSIATAGAITSTVTDETITLTVDPGVKSVDVVGLNGIATLGGPITGSGTISIGLIATGVVAGSYGRPSLTVDPDGRITAITETPEQAPVSVQPGTGIIVEPAGSAYTVSLAPNTLPPGTFRVDTLTLDGFGRITAITERQDAQAPILSINGDITVSGSLGSPLTGVLADSGVVAGIYQNPTVTVDAKGRITVITQGLVPEKAPELSATGVAPGTYDNPSITVNAEGRITVCSSSASAILPRAGNPGEVLTLRGGAPVWAPLVTKTIPADIPAAQSWRLMVEEVDGDGLMGIGAITFRSTIGGPKITVPGELLCTDPGWGTNHPANAFADTDAYYVATASFTPAGLSTIGFTFDSSVVVRDLSIKACPNPTYRAPTRITVQYLLADTWVTAWVIVSDEAWAAGETRAFPSTGGPQDEAFRTLADTPDTYWGKALQHVRVNQTEDGLEFVKMPVRVGPDHQRPVYASADAGTCYFDLDLSKPIWWSGSAWVDAMGDAV